MNHTSHTPRRPEAAGATTSPPAANTSPPAPAPQCAAGGFPEYVITPGKPLRDILVKLTLCLTCLAEGFDIDVDETTLAPSAGGKELFRLNVGEVLREATAFAEKVSTYEAAPDLLVALKKLRRDGALGMGQAWVDACNEADAAIAKAEGKS